MYKTLQALPLVHCHLATLIVISLLKIKMSHNINSVQRSLVCTGVNGCTRFLEDGNQTLCGLFCTSLRVWANATKPF